MAGPSRGIPMAKSASRPAPRAGANTLESRRQAALDQIDEQIAHHRREHARIIRALATLREHRQLLVDTYDSLATAPGREG